MPECGSCTYCCWNFGIDDVPLPSLGFDGAPINAFSRKEPLCQCPHANRGCDIHEEKQLYPAQCRAFLCPYLNGEDIHRPDDFEGLLRAMNTDIPGYIPSIPSAIPIHEAVMLISHSKTILASLIVERKWTRMVIPLHKDPDGNWRSKEADVLPWISLCAQYGVVFQVEPYARA